MRTFAIILAAAVAAPAAAQVSPANAGDIADAVSGCMAAARAAVVDEASLADEGWRRGEIGGKEETTAGLAAYGKSRNNALILTTKGDGSAKAVCAVTARIDKQADYQAVVDAIDALEGVRAIKKDKLQIWFSSGERMIVSDLTGTRETPSVRVAVMTIAER